MSDPKVFTLTAEQIELLLEKKMQEFRQLQTTAAPNFDALASSLEQIAGATGRQADEIARTVRKSVADPPKISVFSHPEGERAHPKARLRYQTYLNNIRVREDELTPEEIETCNGFEQGVKEAMRGAWSATVTHNGTTPQLMIKVPSFSADNRGDLPSFLAIVSTLLKGEDVADPDKALKRLTWAETQIKQLQAQLAAVSKKAPMGAPA
jgi:hypothetical protein